MKHTCRLPPLQTHHSRGVRRALEVRITLGVYGNELARRLGAEMSIERGRLRQSGRSVGEGPFHPLRRVPRRQILDLHFETSPGCM